MTLAADDSRRIRRRGWHQARQAVLALALLASSASAARADPARAGELTVQKGEGKTLVEDAAPATTDVRALARVTVAGPGPRSLTLIAASGYGYTESVLGAGDRHDRALARLGVEGRPTPWLGLALRFDGRYDHHSIPGQAADSGMVGDPRIQIRADRALGGGFAIGARAGLWLPGGNAPSVDWSATTPELVAMASYASPGAPLPITVAMNAGYRYDRSARSASDAPLLSASDRAALGVSAFDAVLLGGSASVELGRMQGYLEWTWDVLVGNGGPPPLTSPMIAGAGVRVAAGQRLGVELAAEVSPSRRPAMSATAPLLPIPPRLAAWVGLTYAFGAAAGAARRPSAAAEAPAKDDRPALAAPPRSRIPVRVIGPDDQPVASPQVFTSRAGGERSPAARRQDGRFDVELARARDGRPLPVTLDVEATGFAAARVTLAERPGSPDGELVVRLERCPPSGQIRGFIRSLRGTTVDAHVEVRDAGKDGAPQALHASDGRFELDVAPGNYEVRVSAAGYESQRRRIQVEQNGVTLLDVDLKGSR